MRLRVRPAAGVPDFLDLPWHEPLAQWQLDRLVDAPTGLHRHVVRVVAYDGVRYFVKELDDRLARREWEILRGLEDEEVPAVTATALVTQRTDARGGALPGAIVTRQLEFALPYRLLFAREDHLVLRSTMLDALVDLVVRLHLVGLLWGDCSLSNALFRRDAGQLMAYFLDAETAQRHAELTDSQREWDLEQAVEKCAGELMDLVAGGVVDPTVDPIQLGDELRDRYHGLWAELTRAETFARDESWRVRDRIGRINELGYDLDEIELEGVDDHIQLRLSTRLVEPGRNRRRLRALTGLDVTGEHLSRALLNDIHAFGAWLRWDEGREVPEEEMAHRWMTEVFEPMIKSVPPSLEGRRDPAQLFYEMLTHRDALSRDMGTDIGNARAMSSYVANVLAYLPEERLAPGDE